MNNILIIGAGLSSGELIRYVLDHANALGWYITIADSDLEGAKRKIDNHPRARAAWLEVSKANDRRDLIARADVVVTLVPAHLHLEVAHDCIRLNKPLVTSSLINKELYRLGDEARNRSRVFMGEMGLDPGLENMSAMANIDDIKAAGATLTSFKSYTGGLMTPSSASNPWKHKLIWSPRNTVLAGQGTAQYLEEGKYRYVPYNRLFKEYETVKIEGAGTFEAYANRDSLLFRDIYGLSDVPDIIRATLRYKGFCDSWDALVQLGLTDGAHPILESEQLTFYDLLDALVRKRAEGLTLKERVATMLGVEVNSKVIKNLHWLGLFSRKKIGIKDATPALILEHVLRSKWPLDPDDQDLILIQQEFEYVLDGQKKRRTSTLQVKGENATNTAMAKVIGLPMAILVKRIMQGLQKDAGIKASVAPEVYEPVLSELESMGIAFKHVEVDI